MQHKLEIAMAIDLTVPDIETSCRLPPTPFRLVGTGHDATQLEDCPPSTADAACMIRHVKADGDRVAWDMANMPPAMACRLRCGATAHEATGGIRNREPGKGAIGCSALETQLCHAAMRRPTSQPVSQP